MGVVCALTTGFPFECDENTGGIKENSLLITQFENVKDGFTIVAGEITAIVQVAGTFFYRYSIKSEIVDFLVTENHYPLIGSLWYEGIINAMLNNMSKEKNAELKLVAQKPLVIILQDLNDVYHAFGVKFGAEKMGGTNTAGAGKEFGTHNGYALGFTSKDQTLFTVSSATIALLDIDGIVVT